MEGSSNLQVQPKVDIIGIHSMCLQYQHIIGQKYKSVKPVDVDKLVNFIYNTFI